MEDYKKYKQIFSLQLAGYLMMNGCRLMRMHHDLKRTGRDIYLFEDTEKLNEKILMYSNKKRTKGNENVTNERSRNKSKYTNCATLS